MENGCPHLDSHLSHRYHNCHPVWQSFLENKTASTANTGINCYCSTDCRIRCGAGHAKNIKHLAKQIIISMKNILAVLLTMITMTTANSQTFHNPDALFNPSPYGFSHVAVVPGGSKLVFVAGQGGEENKEGKLSTDFRTQVQHSLNNIKIALQTQQLPMKSVVKVTTLVVDHNADKLNIIIEEFKKIWPDKQFPVNTLIPVPRLALDNMLVEIDAVAITK
jgi:enamine deaminase RidA (YjgF/YER057c/UK114 family)